MREKVGRLYISSPVLATQVAQNRRNLGSCGSVSVANSTEEKEVTLQSGLDVWIPLENIAYKERTIEKHYGRVKYLRSMKRGRIFN